MTLTPQIERVIDPWCDNRSIARIPVHTSESGCDNRSALGKLYIGNQEVAANHSYLRELEITLVVSMSTEKSIKDPENKIQYHRFPLLDEDVAPCEEPHIITKCRFAARLIRNSLLKGTNVLVHCRAGVNRSALAIGFTLIESFGWSYQDVYDTLFCINRTERRLPVLTNQDFRRILRRCQPKNYQETTEHS